MVIVRRSHSPLWADLTLIGVVACTFAALFIAAVTQ